MFGQKKRLLNRASELIQQKKYAQARVILWKIADDPTARDWLMKIDAIEARQQVKRADQQRKLTTYCGGFTAFICACCVGFMALSAILPDPPPDPVIVEVDARRPIPVFATPGTGSAIATLVQGDNIEIKEKDGEWAQIEIKGSDIRGYVQSTLIVTLTNTPHPTRTPSLNGQVYITGAQGSVNVYSDPSTSGTISGSLAAGTSVTIIGESSGWYRIEYMRGFMKRSTGWVSKQLTSTTRPQPQVNSGGSGNSGGSNPPTQFTCPSNCAGARAMGLSPQQAASCGLDRDHDGVACYGD